MKQITIERIRNGYLLKLEFCDLEYHPNCESLFRAILLSLEGKSPRFSGESFGQVFVADKPDQHFTAVILK
jgi:hypothetical protein